MKKLTVGLAVLACVLVPQALFAQEDEGSETVVVTTARVHVPFGEDRQKFLEFIDRVQAPQAKNNPNVLAFHVLEHYYGADATEVVIVRVYPDLAAIEAPCGEPCETWAAENIPEEGTPEREELQALGDHFFKYFAKHSDEIYTSSTSRSKM